uniref:Tyrosine-protein phosphatase domain-containing protein n=1 Tax=Macrostomum lignano TaxID=282301 RepID=A0A1I8JRJ3_9PLAT
MAEYNMPNYIFESSKVTDARTASPERACQFHCTDWPERCCQVRGTAFIESRQVHKTKEAGLGRMAPITVHCKVSFACLLLSVVVAKNSLQSVPSAIADSSP